MSLRQAASASKASKKRKKPGVAGGSGQKKIQAKSPAAKVSNLSSKNPNPLTTTTLSVRWPSLNKTSGLAILDRLRTGLAGLVASSSSSSAAASSATAATAAAASSSPGAKAWSNGHLVLGINAVTRYLERGQVSLVVVARQIRQPLIQHLPMLAVLKKVPLCGLPVHPKELGGVFGLPTTLGAVAWLKKDGKDDGRGASGNSRSGGGRGGGSGTGGSDGETLTLTQQATLRTLRELEAFVIDATKGPQQPSQHAMRVAEAAGV